MNPLCLQRRGAGLVLTLILALTVLIGSTLQAGPCLPAHPKDVLRFLPDAPPGWEIKKSEARHSFSDWLTTNATREYTRVLAEGASPPADGADGAAVPSVSLRFTDTGRYPRYTEIFKNFKVGKDGHIQGVTIASYPAYVHDLGVGNSMVEVLIEKRFLARFRFQNEPVKSVTDWIRAMNFDAIRAAPGADVTELPEEAELVTIYELQPEKNKSRVTALLTSADVERILEEESAKEAAREEALEKE